jgi:hypothetical protein
VTLSADSFPAAGGNTTAKIDASESACSWTASSAVSWVTFPNGASGTGDATINLAIAANTGAGRTGAVTVAGKTFQITQAATPPPCTFSISPASQNDDAAGGNLSVTVTASASSCTWSVAPNAAWLTVNRTSGTGNGSVTVTVAANSGAARTGTVTIAGQTFTVNQAALTCTFTISPTSASVNALGGMGEVKVTASNSACAWAATSGANWIDITSGTPDTGNGTVKYSVARNQSKDARNGTLTIAGQTFTVEQKGAN